MAAKQASTKRTSLLFGNDSDDTRLALKHFIAGGMNRDLESNVELTKLFPMTAQADRSDGVGVFDKNNVRA